MFLSHRVLGPSIAMLAALPLLSTAAAAAPATALAQAQATWRETIRTTPVPGEGCFTAAYPESSWRAIACRAAPKRLYLPRHGARPQTVGNGNDYAAVTSAIQTEVVGSFPTVTGVTSETGYSGANDYSLQLNSGFMTTAACNGVSGCLSWEQFVYASGEQAAFMQYWLINYGNTCPSGGGWMSYEGSCYKNSAAVSVPELSIKDLSTFKITATAAKGGNDTLTFTGNGVAYATSGKDSVVDLATAWTQSEWNIVGDGGGSAAKFNKGSSVTVGIAITDGSTKAPTCEADDGTTGETNNLTLGSCTASSGSTPSVKFTESN